MTALNTKFVGFISFLVFVFNTCHASSDSTATNETFSETQILKTWGWLNAQERDLAGIEVTDTELRSFLKGIASSAKGNLSPRDLQKISSDVEILSARRREKIVEARKHDNIVESDGFFSALKLNTNVIALPSGSGYEILQPGSGVFPKPQQTVNVHYIGRLIDGTEFIQVGPTDIILVTNHLNLGLFEGMQKINVGGRLRLYVPPAVAEPDAKRMGAPAGATMIFEIEMLGVTNTPSQDLADALVPPAPELPPVPWSGRFTERQVIESWGWSIGRQLRLSQFNFNRTECDAFLEGMKTGIRNEPPPCDLEKIQSELQKFISGRREKAREAFKRKQFAETDALFAKLAKNPHVIVLADGLRYEILKPGTGEFPKSGQRVTVNYTGRLINGKIFDASDPTIGPMDIDLDKVIVGWSEGVQKINRGGKIKLYIPPSLGYGDKSISGIPPDSTLIFEIELLDIKDMPRD